MTFSVNTEHASISINLTEMCNISISSLLQQIRLTGITQVFLLKSLSVEYGLIISGRLYKITKNAESRKI